MHVQSKSQEPNNVIFQLYCEDIMKTPHVHQKRKIKKNLLTQREKLKKIKEIKIVIKIVIKIMKMKENKKIVDYTIPI